MASGHAVVLLSVGAILGGAAGGTSHRSYVVAPPPPPPPPVCDNSTFPTKVCEWQNNFEIAFSGCMHHDHRSRVGLFLPCWQTVTATDGSLILQGFHFYNDHQPCAEALRSPATNTVTQQLFTVNCS